jgi:Protein of unknown function (DUF3365)
LAVAAIVVELFTVVSTPFLENVARAEVLQKARIMMEAAAGIRTYTSNEIAPLLNARTDGEEFHAQTIPAYAATKNFALLASKFRDYAYREAALNPMNLANRAVDWETDIINNFRGNAEKRELVTERETVAACSICHTLVWGLVCQGVSSFSIFLFTTFLSSTRAASILPSRPFVRFAVARSGRQGRRFFAAEGLSLTDASTAACCLRSGCGLTNDPRGACHGARISARRNLVFGRSFRILAMMQSYASAAKLRAVGPFYATVSKPWV